MTCGSCGATIADKAIVCYRCGAPTTAPAAPAAKTATRRFPAGGVVLLVLGVILVGVSVVLPTEMWIARQVARLAGVALCIVAMFRLLTRRR